MVGYCPLRERIPLEMPHLNRKFVCAAETAHDVGKVDGGEESEQVKDDDPLLPVTQPLPASAELSLYGGLSPF